MRAVLPLLLGVACSSTAMAVEYCGVGAIIPDGAPSGVWRSLEISCEDPLIIEDLDVRIEITHTWIGEVTVSLAKHGGPSALVVDQPGAPAQSIFGCSGDDMDVVLSDEAATPVEGECAQTVPSIEGTFIPGDPPGPLMIAFDGLELCGTWEITVTDDFPGFSGSLDRWCLIANSGDGGDGGPAVPATTEVGAILMLLTLLGVSAYFLSRSSGRL